MLQRIGDITYKVFFFFRQDTHKVDLLDDCSISAIYNGGDLSLYLEDEALLYVRSNLHQLGVDDAGASKSIEDKTAHKSNSSLIN